MVEPITQHLFENLGTCKCKICLQIGAVLKRKLPQLRQLPMLQAPAKTPDVLYHFTNNGIKGDLLLPNKAVEYQPAAVWLTENPDAEPLVANAKRRVTVEGRHALYISDIRDKIEPGNFFGLFLSAILVGSYPWEWWLAYQPVPIIKIERAERGAS